MGIASLAAAMATAEMAALGLLIAGAILALIGGIGLLIAGFRESVLWGLGMLFVPFISLIFVVLHWSAAKKPFLTNLAGIGLIVLASVVGKGLPTA